MSVKDRWGLVTKCKLCFVCLQQGHRTDRCPLRTSCELEGCKRLHHKLLHQSIGDPKVYNASCQMFSDDGRVSLGVLPVTIEGPKGLLPANILLDTGADSSLIRRDLAERLGLDGKTENIHLNTPLGEANKRCTNVTFRVQSLDGVEVLDVKTAYTVEAILDGPVSVPSTKTLARWNHLRGVEFPTATSPGVDVLIGLNVPEAHWVLKQRRGSRGDPYADKTPLGWVLRGPLNKDNQKGIRAFAMCSTLIDIESNLKKLYDQDFCDSHHGELSLSAEDKRAVRIAEDSTIPIDGHLCVGLPWKDDQLKGMCNRQAASQRLMWLGKRFETDAMLKKRYAAVINRYLEKGYAFRVWNEEKEEDETDLRWYLPHHAVINPKKPDKLRVVFDCAAVFGGESLNKHLLQGPNIVSGLLGILLRFRQKPVAITADVEDMFLQVKVPEMDQRALRFLWWPEGEPRHRAAEYRLTVHPFGAVSSPFCASFALKKTAILYGPEYPAAVTKAVMNSFYVDDCLLSVGTPGEACELVEQLSQLLMRSGFKLTKWLSNNHDVLSTIPASDKSSSLKELEADALPTQRTLGLAWNMETDSFVYHNRLTEPPATKRELLSQLATVYDPLGWIGPLVLPLKFLFQSLCKEGLGWDDPLEGSKVIKWHDCQQIFNTIDTVCLPRWYPQSVLNNSSEIELHIFSDASERGYGAVAYFRFVGHSSPSQCSLVLAKSRVAPLKVVTIPRLELTAAVIAVELANTIKREIELPLLETTFWTDSSVVRYYIKNESVRYATFVANRVSKIREFSAPRQWRHVPGSKNPADLASRGMSLQPKDHDLWFGGPDFLKVPGKLGEDCVDDPIPALHLIETKKKILINTLTQTPISTYFGRFSSWIALVKWVAWMLRFKQFLLIFRGRRSEGSLRLGPLTTYEMRISQREICKVVQRDSFPREVESLNNGRQCPNHLRQSSIRKLNPIMMDELVCVGGRLEWSDLSECAKHPVILPDKHAVTDLIVWHYHRLEGHVGGSQVLAAIRRKFWIVHGRTAVRRVISKCIVCRRELAQPSSQQMSALPLERVISGGFAFSHVGLDYFGPFVVKHGRAEVKRYGCIFTCLNMRAVHIEVADSLSTDSFLQALIRFMARRGQPKLIVSDNGSNFRGADRELRLGLQGVAQARVNKFLIEREIEWRFNPPEASHWGGVWERLIRSARRILRSISGGQHLTDESLRTFLAEVERIMNNRPLVPMGDDPKDLEVLTPNLLLLLRDNNTILDHTPFPVSCVRFWRRVQLLASTFWKRWRSEYLSLLQERHKWLHRTKNFEPGNLVLVVDENVHRNQWPLARITEVLPDSDGLVREVLVRTSRGILRRDVRKLCLLEGDS